MGMGSADEDGDFAAEFYGLPEFFITHIRAEKLGNGCTRVYHWVERNGRKVPAFMALIVEDDLVVMNDTIQDSLGIRRVRKMAS